MNCKYMYTATINTYVKFIYAVAPIALDHASKSSHNELPADLPVWDSLQKTKGLGETPVNYKILKF